jgi:hypothetical protein
LCNVERIFAAENLAYSLRIAARFGVKTVEQAFSLFLQKILGYLKPIFLLFSHRCSDPKEMGSFSSAINCNACKEGFVLQINPLDACSHWKCQNCQMVLDGQTASKLEDQLERELDRVNWKSPENIKKFVTAYEAFLHPNHAFLCQLKQWLCEGEEQPHVLSKKFESDLSHFAAMSSYDEASSLRTNICRDLLNVYSKTEPKHSYLAGKII